MAWHGATTGRMLSPVPQVAVADPEAWGRCAATDLYRQYSSLCNHQTEDSCLNDPYAQCTFVPQAEYDEVGMCQTVLEHLKCMLKCSCSVGAASSSGLNRAFPVVASSSTQILRMSHEPTCCTFCVHCWTATNRPSMLLLPICRCLPTL
jgi:hypothetical protein